MKKILLVALLFLQQICLGQGVGAGGFNPLVLGLVDTCGAQITITEQKNLNPDNWFYLSVPGRSNPFSDFPLTSGNGYNINQTFWTSIVPDTLNEHYLYFYSFYPSSLDVANCNNTDSINIYVRLKVQNITVADTSADNNSIALIDAGLSPLVSSPTAAVPGDTVLALNYTYALADFLAQDSLLVAVDWFSGIAFQIDGAQLQITFNNCDATEQTLSMRVLINDDCGPVSVQDQSLFDVNSKLDTLITRLPPCLTKNEISLLPCNNAGDTITVPLNTANSIKLHFVDCYDCVGINGVFKNWYYDANKYGLFELEADDCKLLTTKIDFVCPTPDDFIVIRN